MQTARPEEVGLDPKRVERLFAAAEKMTADGLMFGATPGIARRGKLGAAHGVGFADAAKQRRSRADDIYTIFSTTKPVAATLLLMAIDQGKIRLVDRVADHIPEFAQGGKAQVTVAQVLTHTSGFAALAPDWMPDQWGNWDATIARICAQPVQHEPGAAVDYHALTGSWIIGELARIADGRKRSFAELAEDELFGPLKMKDSHFGVRPDMRERLVPLKARDLGGFPFPTEFLEVFDLPALQGAAIPGGGARSTVADLARFYQMWLNAGELRGLRLLAPPMV